MRQFSWDQKSYTIDGERNFLVAGEVHYFRVPKKDWETRLRLLKEANMNCVTTLVPWPIHERTEGEIAFGDTDERDFEGFLQLCSELGLLVICRPGPYQYSEMRYSGLPSWLCDNYPEMRATNPEGKMLETSSISYLHPLFLEKAKKYYDEMCKILSKYTVSKGGPVVMVQVDNELTGIHEWNGGLDYNPVSMGFGQEDGRYVRFLKERYGNVEALNSVYGSVFESFLTAVPWVETKTEKARMRRDQDYRDFYFKGITEYIKILYDWLRGNGVDCQITHNSYGPNTNDFFLEAKELLGKDFLLGTDHYYTLMQTESWDNNPTPQYTAHCFCSLDVLRLMGYPPTLFEVQSGSPSDWPPVLPEDMKCWLMTNLALGMKGLNYYIFTGGPEPYGVGSMSEVYDFCAPISAAGEVRPNYYVVKEFDEFLQRNLWLTNADRLADFHIGMDWDMGMHRKVFSETNELGFSDAGAWRFLRKGLLTTAFCASRSANLADLGSDDLVSLTDKPLMVPTSACMSEKVQRNLIRFVENGGKLLLAPVIPAYDEKQEPCTVLRDYLQAGDSAPIGVPYPVPSVGDIRHVYASGSVWKNSKAPENGKAIAVDRISGTEIGWSIPYPNGGKVILLGMEWLHSKFEHSKMLHWLLQELGCAEPLVECNNPNIWFSLRSDGSRYMLFAMNLFSSPGKADFIVRLPGIEKIVLEDVHLDAMDVKTIMFG